MAALRILLPHANKIFSVGGRRICSKAADLSEEGFLKHFPESIDGYLSSDAPSTEQEVTIAAHAYLKTKYGELVDEPEFNHLVRSKDKRKRLAELDGYICLENNVVGVVEAKKHVKEEDVTALLQKGATTQREEGFSGSMLFIGGPVIDSQAKKYAQAEGIRVVGLSGDRFLILDD